MGLFDKFKKKEAPVVPAVSNTADFASVDMAVDPESAVDAGAAVVKVVR